MNITTVNQKLEEAGYKLERVYDYYLSPCFSVQHYQAIREFVNREVSLHEFYCDMKRLESLELDEVGFGIYDPYSGFATEIKVHEGALKEVLDILKYDLAKAVLVFQLTHHEKSGVMPTPAGNVFKVVTEV